MDINIVDFRIEKDLDGNIEDIYAKHVLLNGNVVEIWFVAKGNSQNSKLYSLVEFKSPNGEIVRNDAKYIEFMNKELVKYLSEEMQDRF